MSHAAVHEQTHMPQAVHIRHKALALGFDDVGITRPDAISHAAEGLDAFLADGHHGSMEWMEARADQRANPTVLWPDARSVIVVAMNYGPDTDPRTLLTEKDHAVISVYARGKDYHDVLKKRLKALGRWMAAEFGCALKVFVDTAPVMEKPLEAAAGLGWQGKHTNLVSRSYGSWLFLGVIYTDMPLTGDTPHADRCGACRACLDSCPTKAFPAPYRLDARRCISYLTIEHKGPIPLEFRKAMGNRIYGCDDCLAACPWNKFARTANEAAFHARVELDAPRLDSLMMLDDAGFRQVFSGSPIKRIGRNRFVRNVLIAVGNSGDTSFLPKLEPLLTDDDPVVREAAVWARDQLLQTWSEAQNNESA